MKRRRQNIASALLLCVLLLLTPGLACFGTRPLQPPPRGVLLDDVELVEPGIGRTTHRRVLVEGNRITSLSAAQGGGQWSGAYVLPGLVDAHAHFPPGYLPGQIELFAFLFLRHGVTGVRVPGDLHPGTSVKARQRIEAGEFAGPRLVTCGRFVDGASPMFSSAIVATNADEARAAVAELAAAEYDCVKVYNDLDAATLAAVREAAHARGLPVIGHVPWRVPVEQAHLDDYQHVQGFFALEGVPRFPSSEWGWLSVTDERIDEVIAAHLREGAAVTPTLIAGERIVHSREITADSQDPAARLLPPWYIHGLWAIDGGFNPAGHMDASDYARFRAAAVRKRQAVKRLQHAGVRLRAGSDTMAPMVVPGASLHQELELFVEAGLTPEEALEIATRGSAGALGVPGLGSLRPGAPADFVVYREDPTQDLAALDTVLAVVQDGRLYSREMLETQEARYREAYDGWIHRRIASPLVRATLGILRRSMVGSGAEREQ